MNTSALVVNTCGSELLETIAATNSSSIGVGRPNERALGTSGQGGHRSGTFPLLNFARLSLSVIFYVFTPVVLTLLQRTRPTGTLSYLSC